MYTRSWIQSYRGQLIIDQLDLLLAMVQNFYQLFRKRDGKFML